MAVHHDQLNRSVELVSVPKRIVSIVPSQTELLFYLGLDAEVIGVTKFCIHPAGKVNGKTKVGGTKQLNIQLIKELKPDLIIGNKEENERSQIEELMQLFPVWMSDIFDLDGALAMIRQIGELVGTAEKSVELAHKIEKGFNELTMPATTLNVAYLIWRKPYMIAGKNTFIDAMLQKCGFANAFDAERYPEVSVEELTAARPDMVFLSSEPYPFKQKHLDEFKKLLPNAMIKLVDGEMFSWYGSRLFQSTDYFRSLELS